MYKEDDLESLFNRTIFHNSHLDIIRLEEMFEAIREDLNEDDW